MGMRKGSILDLPVMGIGLLFVAIILYISYFIINSMVTDPDISSTMNVTYLSMGQDAVVKTTYSFPFYTVAIGLASIVLAFIFRSSPVMLGFSIFIFAMDIMIAATYVNVFEAFMGAFTASVQSAMAQINWPMQNLTYFFLAIGGFIILVTHSKVEEKL